MSYSLRLFILLFWSVGTDVCAQILSIPEAQRELDSMQQIPESSYQIIKERNQKLKNGDEITTAVSFQDKLLYDYKYFIRRYGVKRSDGKELKPVYERIVSWENDQYLIQINSSKDYGKYLALINKDFTVQKVYLEEMSNGNFRLMKDGKWGVVTSYLNNSIPFIYDFITESSPFEEYEILVKEQRYHTHAARVDTSWGLITSENDTIVPFEYQFLSNASGGRIIAKKNGKWGIMDVNQFPIIPVEYDSISNKFGSYYLFKGSKWGIWNFELSNEDVKFLFDEVAINSGRGHDLGRIGKKWYLLNDKPIDSEASFYDDYYFNSQAGPFIGLRKGEKWGIYSCDKKKFVTEFEYSKIIDVLYERGEDFSNGRLVRSYPVRHFTVVKPGGKVEDLLLQD